MAPAARVFDEVDAPEDNPYGPYLTLDRQHWASLAASRPDNLDDATLERLRGIDDPTDAAEVREVYLPLTDLLSLYIERTGALFADSHRSSGSPAGADAVRDRGGRVGGGRQVDHVPPAEGAAGPAAGRPRGSTW